MNTIARANVAADARAMPLARLLEAGASQEEIAHHVGELSPAERVEQLLDITGKQIERLYEAVAGAPPLALEEMVPWRHEGTAIFEGRNSLPMFSRFQKRFARVRGRVVGYNHQWTAFMTGPGFFAVELGAKDGPHPGELIIDYTRDPIDAGAGWPKYTPNDRGLSRLVYMNMKDYCRRVGPGVLVGKAYRAGAPLGAYFSLSRQP